MVITRVSPMSCAKVAGILYALMGLIIGGGISLFAVSIGSLFPNRSVSDSSMGMFFGAAAVIVLPIVYGVIGGIMAAVSAVIYNVAARMVGGLEISVETTAGPA